MNLVRIIIKKNCLISAIKIKLFLKPTPLLQECKKLDDPKVLPIAKKHNKTVAQVLIRWAIEHEIVVIPKSAHKERIIENANVFDFELDESDMKVLNDLDEGFRVSWDPTTTD